MKQYKKEIILFVLQLYMFYIFPLFAGPTDAMGMVLLILMATVLLAFLVGVLSDKKIKYLYPFVIAIVFIPSVFIYYNSSALVHAVWYLVVALPALLLGVICRLIYKKCKIFFS